MDERITPQMVINHYCTRKKIEISDLGVAPIVVISWANEVVDRIADQIKAKLSENWMYGDRQQLYIGEMNGQDVSIVRMPVGAPGTIMHMEEMIVCGAHTFIGLGWAGALQPDLPIGSLILPTTCIREEGTSPHYLADEVQISADPDLLEHLSIASLAEGMLVRRGPHWTTDAPYRELVPTIDRYRQQGILGVDMETSAMYALGQFRNVRVANLLVISDEVWHEWRPAFGSHGLREATIQALRVVVRCLKNLTSDDSLSR